MKRILITGAKSYIGESFEKWLKQWSNEYQVDTIDMIDNSWREKDFSQYQTVFHVAGIAHADIHKASKETQDLYLKVNCDLAIETATKAKIDGVKQFIFMSSIIIYGENIPSKKMINRFTEPKPSNFYGKSKLLAEQGIMKLVSDDYKIVVIRPPMIYGKESKGNYPKLSRLAKTIPFFVDYKNKRSMLYINNLCEFVRLMIKNEENGIFFPQNDQYSCTSEMVKTIAEVYGKKIVLTKLFNPLIKIFSCKINLFKKIFGNCIYDFELSKYKENYIVCDYKTSIKQTEME